MAYYSKEQIVEYINVSCDKIAKEKHAPVTDPQEALKKLADEQDLVGFFWLEMSTKGDSGVGIQMEGKVFVKLNSKIYSDDRFAIDSYQAAKEGISVTDLLDKRELEKNEAQKNLTPDVIEGLKNFLNNK
jgi:hypothetical protein